MIDVKYKPIFRSTFILLIIAGSIWLLQQTFWGLISYLSPQFLLGLKPIVHIVVIWKAYKWATNEFDSKFSDNTNNNK